MLSPESRGACADGPMPKDQDPGFRPTILSLWFGLINLGIVGSVFSEVLSVDPGRVQGWSHYVTAQALRAATFSRFPELAQKP